MRVDAGTPLLGGVGESRHEVRDTVHRLSLRREKFIGGRNRFLLGNTQRQLPLFVQNNQMFEASGGPMRSSLDARSDLA